MCFNKLMLTAVLITFPIFQSVNACELVFASGSSEPFLWQENKRYKGIAVDLFKLISADSGCEVSFQIKPWKRVLHELNKGTVDMTLAFHNIKREQYSRYAEEGVGEFAFYLYTKPTLNKIKNIEDLFAQKKSLMYLKNWYLGKLKPKVLAHSQSSFPVMSVDQGVKLVLNNRSDALLAPEITVLYALKKINKSDQLIKNSAQLESFKRYVIFSKKSVPKAIYQRINTSINKIVASGKMSDIVKSYTQ